MMKQNSSSVRVHEAGARRAAQSYLRHAGLSLGLLSLLVAPGLTAADPRRTGDPQDPAGPPVQISSITIADSRVKEGDNGTTMLRFRVNVIPESPVDVSVAYTVLDRSASSGAGDYQATQGTLYIPANTASSEIDVPVNGDKSQEGDETVLVALSDAHDAALLKGFAVGTIVNDDFNGGGGGPRQMPEGAGLAASQQLSFGLACSNPVRGGSLGFRFALPRASHVSIAIYDMAGRLVGQPYEGDFAAGSHIQAWSQMKPANGMYFARMNAGGQVLTQRISWID